MYHKFMNIKFDNIFVVNFANVFLSEIFFRYKLYAERLRPLVKDTISYLHQALKDGRSILVEGANAAMLDIDFGKATIKRYSIFKTLLIFPY